MFYKRAFQVFNPEAIVLQCGADTIRGDPIGEFNVTPVAIRECLRQVLNKNLPTMVLGGGKAYVFIDLEVRQFFIVNKVGDLEENLLKVSSNWK